MAVRYKAGAIAAIAGALLLLAGTLLHPFSADPNDPLAAFTEYAADRSWVASHLMQLTGVVLMVFALAVLSRAIGDNSLWSHVGVVGAGASLAVAAVLQAVDGVALKMMVDRWAAAPAAEKDVLFYATVAVRQIEIGLASITSLLFGVTATIYGVALLSAPRFSRWLGWLAVLGGMPTAVGGIIIAYTGFSGLAMGIIPFAISLLLVWMILVGVRLWRL